MSEPCPALQAYEVYRREPCHRSFEDDMELHMLNGYVFATPEYFVMGRPVDMRANKNAILDPAVTFPSNRWNCWHCALYAGNLQTLFTLLPFELPYWSFQKRNRIRFYTANQLKQRFSHAR